MFGPYRNLSLGESEVFTPGVHRRPVVIEGGIDDFVGDKVFLAVATGQPVGIRKHYEGGGTVAVVDDLDISMYDHRVS